MTFSLLHVVSFRTPAISKRFEIGFSIMERQIHTNYIYIGKPTLDRNYTTASRLAKILYTFYAISLKALMELSFPQISYNAATMLPKTHGYHRKIV